MKFQTTIYEKHKKPCEFCKTIYNLTQHHIKNRFGEKTGEIQILCRKCHDIVEEDYEKLGMIKHRPMSKAHIKRVEKSKLEKKKRLEKNRYNLLINSPHYQIFQMRNERDRTLFSIKMMIHTRKKQLRKHMGNCYKSIKYQEKIHCLKNQILAIKSMERIENTFN